MLSGASAGCNRILRDGARPVRSAEDVLEDLRLGRVRTLEQAQEILRTLTAPARKS